MGVGDSLQFSHPVLWVPHRQKPSLIVLVETKLKETDKSLRKLSLCQNSCKTLKPLRVMTVLLHWSRALCYIATSDSILGMQQVAYFMNFLFLHMSDFLRQLMALIQPSVRILKAPSAFPIPAFFAGVAKWNASSGGHRHWGE